MRGRLLLRFLRFLRFLTLLLASSFVLLFITFFRTGGRFIMLVTGFSAVAGATTAAVSVRSGKAENDAENESELECLHDEIPFVCPSSRALLFSGALGAAIAQTFRQRVYSNRPVYDCVSGPRFQRIINK